MSRGPGRIERAVRALFDAHPDEAFTVEDLCIACYPGQQIARKHHVAVWRAAHKVLASDPNWQSSVASLHRGRLILCNRASVPSMVMRSTLHDRWLPTREAVLGRTRELLDEPPETPEEANAAPYTDGWRLAQRRKEREQAIHWVNNHRALRDADPAERLTEQRNAIIARRQAGSEEPDDACQLALNAADVEGLQRLLVPSNPTAVCHRDTGVHLTIREERCRTSSRRHK